MKWLQSITRLFKTLKGAIKMNRIAQASLAISIVLLCRKLFRIRSASAAEARAILENISAFYNKLRSNKIKSVSILASSISYTDIHENIFSAVLPRHAQATLES